MDTETALGPPGPANKQKHSLGSWSRGNVFAYWNVGLNSSLPSAHVTSKATTAWA